MDDFFSKMIKSVKKNVPADVLIEMMRNIPGPSVLLLCSSSKIMANFCDEYERKIYLMLLQRDFPILCCGNIKDPKLYYLQNLSGMGQPYTISAKEIINKPGLYKFGSLASVPILGETPLGTSDGEITYWPKKLTFYLGPTFMYGEKTLISDFKPGSKYFIAGFWPGTGTTPDVYTYKNMKKAVSNVLLEISTNDELEDFSDTEIKKAFPYNYKDIRTGHVFNDVIKIIENDSVIFFISQTTLEGHTFFAKKVVLSGNKEQPEQEDVSPIISSLPPVSLNLDI